MSAGGTKPTLSKNIDRKNGVTSVDKGDNTQANQWGMWTNDRAAVDWWELQFWTTSGTPQRVAALDVYCFDDVRALSRPSLIELRGEWIHRRMEVEDQRHLVCTIPCQI